MNEVMGGGGGGGGVPRNGGSGSGSGGEVVRDYSGPAGGWRSLSLGEAKEKYVHRFTMEWVPGWANRPQPNGRYPAPQFKSDAEWYTATIFPHEPGWVSRPDEDGIDDSCITQGQTWPLGVQDLNVPYAAMVEHEYKLQRREQLWKAFCWALVAACGVVGAAVLAGIFP